MPGETEAQRNGNREKSVLIQPQGSGKTPGNGLEEVRGS